MKHLFFLTLIVSALAACNSGAEKAAEAQKKQQTIDSLNAVLVKQRVVDSMKAEQAKAVKKNTQVTQSSVTNGEMETTTSSAAKKKGLNHTAKGAIVGAGAGAITGAIINHNDRVKGAAVGTVLGAGIGAGTGLIVDKSVKKKKQKAATTTTKQ